MKDLRLRKGSREHKRFWAKVDKKSHPVCWVWTGSLGKQGYGSFWLRGGAVLPHRVSYTSEYGPIDDDFGVHHNCDNRKCIRPLHLVTGGQQDNMLDALERGRLEVFTGENHKCSKLKEADIPKIRADTRSEVKIAKDYGVSRALIGQIKRYETWKHIKGEVK